MNFPRITISSRQALTALCALAAVFLAPAASADITTGLRSWYRFEGNVNDSSGLEPHGASAGNVQYGFGQAGRGLLLDGSAGAYADIKPDAYLPLVTVSTWVRPASTADAALVQAWKDGENYSLDISQGKFRAMFRSAGAGVSVSAPAPVTANATYHVAMTFDGANTRLYINGSPQGSVPVADIGTPPNTTDLRVGIDKDGQKRFSGMIDEMRIYDRALSDADIAQLHTWTPPLNTGNSHTAALVRAESQHLSCPDSAALSVTGDFTLECFAQFRTDGSCALFNKGGNNGATGGYGLDYDAASHRLRAYWYSSSNPSGFSRIYTGFSPVPGDWYHLAAAADVDNAAAARLFINGQEMATTVESAAAVSVADNDRIAAIGLDKDNTTFFDGSVDEVRVWGFARTAAHIRKTMFLQLTGGESGLRACWRMNDSLTDVSPNGNTLTAQAGAAFRANDLPFFDSSRQHPWIPDSHTAALFRFEGNPANSVPGGAGGTATGAVAYNAAAGRIGSGVEFNGGPHIAVPDSDMLDFGGGDFSVSLWIKSPGGGSGVEIIEKQAASAGGYFQIKWSDSGGGRIDFESGSFNASVFAKATSALPASDNQWHHILLVRTGNTIKGYMDGVLSATATAAGSFDVSNDGALKIGAGNGGAYHGSLDELTIFKHALSAEEVMKYYGGIVSARFTALSGDGSIDKQSGTNWALLRNAAVGDTTYGADASRQGGIAGGRGNSDLDFIERGFYPFDTAALPDSAIVSHASLNIHTLDTRNPPFTHCPFYVTPQAQASVTSLTTADFSAVTLNSSPLFSDRITSVANDAYNAFSLNAAGRAAVSATGFTRLGTRSQYDVENTGEGRGEENVAATFSESSEKKPFLLVESIAANVTASISGTVSGASGAGTVRVRAQSGSAFQQVNAGAGGSFIIPNLAAGAGYTVTAFQDANGNGAAELNERQGVFAMYPIFLDSDVTGVNITLLLADEDGDWMPGAWELANGLNPANPTDGQSDLDHDGLSNVQEYWLNLAVNDEDSDDDGVKDGEELSRHGTNPLKADTDGDGMLDKWETDQGLDPRRDDRDEDRDGDFLTNTEEYRGGLNSTNPGSAFSGNDGISDYVRAHPGSNKWTAMYDRNDRLLGIRHARGASFVQAYDGNSNPVHQVKLGLDSDHDGLSDLWEFVNGLDSKSADGVNGFSGDSDGDGWSNYQELIGGSAPSSPDGAGSVPGVNGRSIGAITVPFIPTNFVAGAGQLDFGGAEEIVIGADGDIGAANNFVRIYTEAGGAWTSADVPVGSCAVTSIAVGQMPGRSPAIYLGLRKAGGSGRVVELARNAAGAWQPSAVIAESLSEAAWVHGLRSTAAGTDLILGFAPAFGPEMLHRAIFENGVWQVKWLELSAGRAEQGVIAKGGASDKVLRRLAAGGIQVVEQRTPTPITFDEFNDDTFTAGVWTKSESSERGHPQQTEAGGFAIVECSWDRDGYARSSLAANLVWPIDAGGMEIRLERAEHEQEGTKFDGEAQVLLGGTQIFSTGHNGSFAGIDLQILRRAATVFFRHRTGGGAWSGWRSANYGAELKFEAAGRDIGSNSSDGSAKMLVDYVRFNSAIGLLAAGASQGDLPAGNANDFAYHAASNTWYFRTPGSLSWVDAQKYAFEQSGNLAAADADRNAWLTSKFNGEYWIGHFRDTASSAWRWVSGAPTGFAAWAEGQPGTAADQLFAFSSNGSWSAASSGEFKSGIFEMKPSATETVVTVENETAAIARLPWRGRQLTAGRFNAGDPAQVSAIVAFIDDTDNSGTAGPTDTFVIGERVLGSSPGAPRSDVRLPLISGSTVAFGIASLRPEGAVSDVLIAGEPNGQVSAWAPEAANGPLTRKLLSVLHARKAWHAFERVAMPGNAAAAAGLRVTPSAPQTAELFLWAASDLGFASIPVIQQSPPSASISATPSSGSAQAGVDVRLRDSEGNLARVALRFQNPPGAGAWTDATLLTIAGQPVSANPFLSAPPAGATHRVIWNAAQVGPGYSGAVLLQARASDLSGAGEWSLPMFYTVDLTQDTDGDGMPNSWELANGLNPAVPDAQSDLDGDSRSNIDEFIAGTNPRDSSSAFRITSVSRSLAGVFSGQFTVEAGHTYSMEWASSPYGPWTRLQNFSAQSAGFLGFEDNPGQGAKRYYRATTPMRQ